MPKRKNDEKDFDYLCKKLRKIEEEIRRDRRREDSVTRCRRRVRVISSSSDSSQGSAEIHDRIVTVSVEPDAAASTGERSPRDSSPSSEHAADPPSAVTEPPPPAPAAAASVANEDSTAVAANESTTVAAAADQQESTPELDADILEILGIDPTSVTTYGTDIQKDLAVRLEHNATEGLTKETRKELLDLYLVPNNCKRVGAPVLNLELKAALTEQVVKRDKAIETKQKVSSAAISSLGQAITHVLSSKEKDTKLLRLLMDTGRMLCDCQHSDTVTRRNYVLSAIKKEMKESLQTTKIDTYLFGEKLPDTLKAAKAINRSGTDLKVNPTPKPGTSKKPAQGSSKNWRNNPPRKQAPAQNSKETATTTTPPAATRNQRSSYSRTSQSQRSTRNRR